MRTSNSDCSGYCDYCAPISESDYPDNSSVPCVYCFFINHSGNVGHNGCCTDSGDANCNCCPNSVDSDCNCCCCPDCVETDCNGCCPDNCDNCDNIIRLLCHICRICLYPCKLLGDCDDCD